MKTPFVLNYVIVKESQPGAKRTIDAVEHNGRTYAIYENSRSFSAGERCLKALKIILPTLFSLGLVLLAPKFRYDWQAVMKGKGKLKMAVLSKEQASPKQRKVEQTASSILNPEEGQVPAPNVSSKPVNAPKPLEPQSGSQVNVPEMPPFDDSKVRKILDETPRISTATTTSGVATTAQIASNTKKDFPVTDLIMLGGDKAYTSNSDPNKVNLFKEELRKILPVKIHNALPDQPLANARGIMVLTITSRFNHIDPAFTDTYQKLTAAAEGKAPLLIVLGADVNASIPQEVFDLFKVDKELVMTVKAKDVIEFLGSGKLNTKVQFEKLEEFKQKLKEKLASE